MIVGPNGELGIWTLYDHPRDYPNDFVARLYYLDQPTDQMMRATDLNTLREYFAFQGLYRLPRAPGDDPNIIETWL